jgi:hypothetical protein
VKENKFGEREGREVEANVFLVKKEERSKIDD